jgi:hypothetical protein
LLFFVFTLYFLCSYDFHSFSSFIVLLFFCSDDFCKTTYDDNLNKDNSLMKLNNTLPPMGSLANNKAPQAKPNLNTQRDGKVQAIFTTNASSTFSLDQLLRGFEGFEGPFTDFHISTNRVNEYPLRRGFDIRHILSIEDPLPSPSRESLKRELETMSILLRGNNNKGYPRPRRPLPPITSLRIEFQGIPSDEIKGAFMGLRIPQHHLFGVKLNSWTKYGPTLLQLIPTIKQAEPWSPESVIRVLADLTPENVIRGLAQLTEALSKSL